MKTKHLLFALAAPLFVAACTNDEFEVSSTQQNLGEVISTEGLTLKAGFNDAQTRMSFDGKQLKWILDYAATDNQTDELGLCLALDGKAQTNYQWVVSTLVSAQGNKYKIASGGSAFEPAAPKQGDTDVEIVSNKAYAPFAEFTTLNATIFGGNYIAYYPYSEDFKEVSATIPVSIDAIQETSNGLADDDYVGNYAFYVSDPFAITGGQTEADFTMRQVLPILRFDLKNVGSAAVEVSKIEVSADGGMPVAAGIDANLTAPVTLANIHVDAEKNVDSQLLVVTGGKTINAGATGNTAKAYMVVMPGDYANLKVKVIMSDGAYIEKTVEKVSLDRSDLQPVEIDLDSDEMTRGDVFSQVTSAADLKNALTAAASSANGKIEINVIRDIEGQASDLFPTSGTTMAGANVIVKGSKITVKTSADCSSLAALKNVTFENEVEFKAAYTTNAADKVTYAGKTTFADAVTVTGGSVLNIGGTATAKGNVTVGSATTPAALNINEDAVLNVQGAELKTAAASYAHAINVAGTLNLNNKADGSAGATLSAGDAINIIKIGGTVNVSSKSKLTLGTATWKVGNGTINNGGTLVTGTVAALGQGESKMTLINNGLMTAAFSSYNWSDNKVTITNNGTYMLTGCTIDNLKTIVKNDQNKFGIVNGIEAALTTTIQIEEDYLDMSKYAVTFNVAEASSTPLGADIQVAAGTWQVGELTFVYTSNATNAATVTIKPSATTAVESASLNAGKVNVIGDNVTNFSNCVLKFDVNSNATISATIGSLYVENAVFNKNSLNVTWTSSATSGSTTIQ